MPELAHFRSLKKQQVTFPWIIVIINYIYYSAETTQQSLTLREEMPGDILANKEIKNNKVAKSNQNPDLAQDLGENQREWNLMKRVSEFGGQTGIWKHKVVLGFVCFMSLLFSRPPPAAATEAPLNLLEVYILWARALVP